MISKQIGWSTESNLLWEILRQLTKLGGTLSSLIAKVVNLEPKYKVYTALLTQSGSGARVDQYGGDLTIGVSYVIVDNGGSGWDFTNVGAPDNNISTHFVATGTTPNSWGIDGQLNYDEGAPVATVLENTIGNIWFGYENEGIYSVYSNDLFTENKTSGDIDSFISTDLGVQILYALNTSNKINIITFKPTDYINNYLINTRLEIRVYS